MAEEEIKEDSFSRLLKNPRAIFTWLGGISPFVRLIIGSALGAFGGSTFIGFLNTYAVYNYAYQHGSRIPVEGVPYLGLAASLVSFAFFFLSMISATFIYGVLLLVSGMIRSIFSSILSLWRRYITKKVLANNLFKRIGNIFTAILSSVVTSSLLSLIYAAIVGLIPKLIPIGIDFISPKIDFSFPNGLYFGVIVSTSIILAILSIWPWLVKWFVTMLAFFLIMLTCYFLFKAPFYGSFLRIIRYGGGTAVEVYCQQKETCQSTSAKYLFLITSDVYVFYDENEEVFIEIPKSKVERTRYLINAEYALPSL